MTNDEIKHYFRLSAAGTGAPEQQAAGPSITLYDISCLLRLFADPREDQPNVHVLNRLKAEGLVCHDGEDWAVSEKGRVFCEAIRALPLPVQQWRMP